MMKAAALAIGLACLGSVLTAITLLHMDSRVTGLEQQMAHVRPGCIKTRAVHADGDEVVTIDCYFGKGEP
jgi:predicted outer membrane lipoprotein